MSNETLRGKSDQNTTKETFIPRPKGTLSEEGLIAFVKLLKRKRIRSLKDLLPYLESGFESLSIPNGTRDEIKDAVQALKDREEKPGYLAISSAKVEIDGKECAVLVAVGNSGSKGFAPASLLTSEVVSASFTNPNRYIKPADIQKGLEHQPGLSESQAIALINENLEVLSSLFSFRRQVAQERWHYQLKPIDRGFRIPTPPEWGNGSIPNTRKYERLK